MTGAKPLQVHAVDLAPLGEWQVERTAESCRLWRDFGPEQATTTISIYAYGPDDAYRVVISGPQVPRDAARSRLGMVQWGAGPARSMVLVNGRTGEQGMLSFLSYGPRPPDQYFRGWQIIGEHAASIWLDRSADSLTLATARYPETTFVLGPLAPALARLAQCQEQLALGWGLAPAALAPGAVPPELPDWERVFERLSMPEGMVLNRVTVIAQIRVMIGAAGQPLECVVQSPTLERSQQRGLCRAFREVAGFTPGRDAQGNNVASVYRGVYVYYIFD